MVGDAAAKPLQDKSDEDMIRDPFGSGRITSDRMSQ